MTANKEAYSGPERESRINEHKYRRQMLRQVFSVLKQDEAVLSRQVPDEDLFQNVYREHALLEPPYSFTRLYTIYEESDVLQSCVEAMQQNVDGFGYKLQFLGDDMKEKESPEAQTEFHRIKDFMDHANENESWMLVRKKMREDLEVLGNSAVELVRNLRGELTLAYHAPFKNLRISAKTGRAITVPCQIPRDGKIAIIRVKKYFRKYCQISSNGKRMRWFKEFGDPRVMDAVTGDYVTTKPRLVASEIWHHRLFFGGMAYGMPRWVGAVLQVMGRRSAQFVNYDLFENQGIPPMAILVSGGVLTDESLEEIEEIIRSIRGVSQWNRIMILESNVEGVGLEDKGNAKLELKNLAEYRKEDQMFNKYLTTTERDTRHRFRLPPLYVGQSETFCMSSDTETLTENGWKFFWEVGKDEKIATLNPDTDCLEYHVPKNGRPYVFDYDGSMCHFENTAVDALVTLDHWAYLSKRIGAPWEKVKASNIFEGKGFNYRVLFKMAPVSYEAPDVDEFELPVFQRRTDNIRGVMRIPMDDMLTLTGLYLGDGSPSDGEKAKQYHISLGAKKERKLRIFKEIGEHFGTFEGISYSFCEKQDGSEKITISGRGLYEWIVNNCGIGAHNKHIPEEFMHLNSRQSELILEGLIATDGNVRTGRKHDSLGLPNACRFVSTSMILANQVQLLAFKCGYRTAMPDYHDSSPDKHDIYYVNMVRKGTIPIHHFQYERVQYRGPVYCFEVPNHLFVTRRNGKIGIHGNTHATAKAAQTVAEEQVFIPERIEFDEPMNNKIVMEELKVTQWKYVSKGPRIVGSQEISKGIEVFSKVGAFTINHAIERANEAFGLDMSKFDLPFAKFPITVVIEMLKQGMPIAGLEDLQQGEVITGNLEQLPGGKQPKQLLLPGPTEKIFKSDIFSDTEKSLYKLLIGVQHAVENAACQHESSL